jgi:cytidylate kinase
MAIISISKGSYTYGKEVAERVADKLGCPCLSRDLLLETSDEFNIPEFRLTKALEEAPSVFERFTGEKGKYLAFIEATLLEHAQKDNIVYHGFAGHLILKRIKHAFCVRVAANTELRVKCVMDRDKVSYEEALRLLTKIDQTRKQWGLCLYGIDLGDSSSYDLVINVDKITLDNAVDTIYRAAGWEQFKATPESQAALDELALAATMKAKLLPVVSEVAVAVDKGTVSVKGKVNPDIEDRTIDQIRGIANTLPGVADLKIDLELVAPRVL